MPYTPPEGWVEDRSVVTQDGQVQAGVFHVSSACTRIRDMTRLRRTDKPYSAKRCRLCADVAAPRETVG